MVMLSPVQSDAPSSMTPSPSASFIVDASWECAESQCACGKHEQTSWCSLFKDFLIIIIIIIFF